MSASPIGGSLDPLDGPLDEDGKALQLMRSWFTAMPGEVSRKSIQRCTSSRCSLSVTPEVTPQVSTQPSPPSVGFKTCFMLRSVLPSSLSKWMRR